MKFYVILCFFFLLTSSFALADLCPENLNLICSDNPKPTITITYDASDAPVLIRPTDYVLLNSNFDEISVSLFSVDGVDVVNLNQNYEGTTFVYKVNQFLTTDIYTFLVEGEIQSSLGKGTVHETEVRISIDYNGMPIWVTNPRIETIQPPELQDVAMSNSIPFDLTLESQFPATCKMIRTINAGSFSFEDLGQLYDDATIFFNDGSSAEVTTHEINVDLFDNIVDSQLQVPVFGSFDYDNYLQSAGYLVICRQESAGGATFSGKEIFIGYDDSPPTITTNFDPEALSDLSSLATILEAQTSDDFVSCTYEFTSFPPIEITKINFDRGVRPFQSEPESIHDYAFSQEKLIQFDEPLPDGEPFVGYLPGELYTFELDVVCTNPAGLSSSVTDEVTIELDNALIITPVSTDVTLSQPELPFYSSSSPEISFTTNLLSRCWYDFGSGLQQISEDYDTSHSFSLSGLDEDSYAYAVDIQCETPNNLLEKITYPFVVDRTPPTAPEVLSEGFTCTSDLEARLAEPTLGENFDLVQYQIELYEEGRLLGSFTSDYTSQAFTISSSLFSDVNIIGGKIYSYSIKAIDGIGQESSVLSHPIERLFSFEPQCDVESPTGELDALLTIDGYEVRITCEDPERNCAPTYEYALVDLGASCEGVSLNEVSSTFVITFDTDQRVCYQVYDTAEPIAHRSSLYEEDITPEVNIELISPRSGIANSTDFTLEFSTKSKEGNGQQCLHGRVTTEINQLVVQEDYVDLFSVGGLEELDTNLAETIHSTLISASTSPHFDDNLEEQEVPWVIVCKENNVEVYSVKTFDLGFDTTNPDLSLSVTPPIVNDPENMRTSLQVISDDPVFCEYRDENEDPYQSFSPFENVFFRDYDTYETSFAVDLIYDKFDIKDVYELVRCYNLADLKATDTIPFRVEALSDLDITILTDIYQSQEQFLFEASTPSQRSRCEVRRDDGNFVDFNIQTNLVTLHQHNMQLDAGLHDVAVQCTGSIFGQEGFTSTEIFVDIIDPTSFVVVKDPTCSLSELEITSTGAHGTGTEIVSFSYQILDGETVLYETSNPELSSILSLSLEENKKYIIESTAVDQSGRSSITTREFRATSFDGSCDEVAPTANLRTQDRWGGVDVFIECVDDVACASAIYSFDDDGSCDSTQGRVLLSLEGDEIQIPELVEESTFVCYQVIDEAGNPSEIMSQYVFASPSCYNGLADTDENGVDCGGICAISCSDAQDQCRNDVQDLFEEGIDCGGVCSLSCSADFPDDIIRDPTLDEPVVLVNPPFGLSNTKDITFEVATIDAVSCRHGFYAPARPDNDADWFATLDNFAITTGTTHQEVFIEGSISQLNYALDESSTQWVVLCDFGEGLYEELVIDNFGFDTTTPEVTVYALPNPVIDPGNMQTTLYVESSDEVVCTYLTTNLIPQYFPGNDLSDRNTYDQNHSAIISYWGKDNYIDQQVVNCRNLAQTTVRQTHLIEVSPEDQVRIDIKNKNQVYGTSSVTIEVETGQLATCEYRFSETDSYSSFSQSEGTSHSSAVSLEEGDHTIEVLCTGLGSGLSGVRFADFTIDQTIPSGEIYSGDTSCSLNDLSFSIKGDGTGSNLRSYEYEVSSSGQLVASGNTTSEDIDLSLDLIDGATYSISVTLYDEADNVATLTTSMVASDVTDDSCDVNPPLATVEIISVYGGAQINLSCLDTEDNCASTFGYYIGEDCLANFTQASYNLDLPLFSSTGGVFCYDVYDTSGNSVSGEEPFEVVLQCLNGVQDPDEEGLDCGGPCAALCDTCNNGIEDDFEEGIDCGGVCSTSCSSIGSEFNETEGDSTTPSTIECTSDFDCALGERCNFDGVCVFDSTTQPTTSSSLSAVIILLLGVLMMLGGGGYVYYSRTHLKDLNSEQANVLSEEQRKQQAALLKKREEAAKKRKEELALKRKQEHESLIGHQKERKDKRSSLLSVFKDEVEKEETSSKSPSKLLTSDSTIEGSKEDYVLLGNQPKKQKTIFDKLKQLTNGGSEEDDYDSLDDVPAPDNNSVIKKKKSVFDKLDTISGRSNKKETFSKLKKISKKK